LLIVSRATPRGSTSMRAWSVEVAMAGAPFGSFWLR
jgi:hypothetical protein